MRNLYLLVFLVSTFVHAQVISIPDANFKAKLLQSSPLSGIARNQAGASIKIDTNNNGEIEQSEALMVYELNINRGSSNNPQFQNVIGLQYFTNLWKLECIGHLLTEIDITTLVNLTYLNLGINAFTSIDVSHCTELVFFGIEQNNLGAIDISMLSHLENVVLGNNENLTSLTMGSHPSLVIFVITNAHLSSVDLSGCPNLQKIYANTNYLTSLDVSGKAGLTELYCRVNQLASINLSGCTALTKFECEHNQLLALDVSECTALSHFRFDNNESLLSLNMKNGRVEDQDFECVNLHNLHYACCDDDEAAFLLSQMMLYNEGSDVVVNSYCSFEPGGLYYVADGVVRFDANGNGCDNSDLAFPNPKFYLSGTPNGSYFVGANNGEYAIPMVGGTYTLTPVLENPSYFSVSPSSATVSFPAMQSPHAQSFCLTPNGTKHDVEVSIIPMVTAIPGNLATYRIVCHNAGNQPASGSIQFGYDGSLMNLANAGGGVWTPGNLAFSFADRPVASNWEYNVAFNLNTPVAVPPLNSDDILTFTSTIQGSGVDETPENNTFVLRQTVLNSFDPNDKTCLEGNTLDPSMAGKYVHYLIRFENTGTAPAQNIVVKDLIDTSKFVVTSLIPLEGSHPFRTRITATNKVEFIFEDIQLPFDDANNDGFVAFKIKTKPTLVAGNTFSNTASIYFDYNAPIVTNTATTTLQALGASDFDFDRYFTIWPNPASNILHIKGTPEVRSAQVYDLNGRLLSSSLHTNDVDVTKLAIGTYLLKVHTEKGDAAVRFVKN